MNRLRQTTARVYQPFGYGRTQPVADPQMLEMLQLVGWHAAGLQSWPTKEDNKHFIETCGSSSILVPYCEKKIFKGDTTRSKKNENKKQQKRFYFTFIFGKKVENIILL